MARFFNRGIIIAASIIAASLSLVSSALALTLISPTEGRAIRETAKIQVPASVVSESGFISLYVNDGSEKRFAAGLARSSAKESAGTLTFYWNTKAPYHDEKNPMEPKYFKDGNYALTVNVHGTDGKIVDTGSVNIVLKNKVARTNPAPAVKLANMLQFGQINTYDVSADVDVFDSLGLPILGGLGIAANFNIVQSVEDRRDDGTVLLRYRVEDDAYVRTAGFRKDLYKDTTIKPQLYRLVNKYGDVLERNVFTKQKHFGILDIMPVLPHKNAKEGDSWQDKMGIKIDGITNEIQLSGTAQLDSFEWQNGVQCAKIISTMKGHSSIDLANGRITSSGEIDANVITYFSYGSGRLLRREVTIEFPAVIQASAADIASLVTEQGGEAAAPASPSSSMTSDSEDAMDEDPYGPPSPSGNSRSESRSEDTATDKTRGRVSITAIIKLEK